MRSIYLRDDLAELWQGLDPFAEAFAATGDVARDMTSRQTLRVDLGGRSYYLKRHFGVGWGEIVKNWLTGKRPVVDASNEYRASEALQAAGIDALPVAGFGVRGRNPATRESFPITDDLEPAVSLETLCVGWPESPPSPAVKRELIERVAGVARTMHGIGINHNDFYLCHFLLRGEAPDPLKSPLHLIDLHRAEQRDAVPRRWLVKDLAGLYHSAMDVGLTQRDLLRFLKRYFDLPLREITAEHGGLLQQVNTRAQAQYDKARAKGILPRQVAGLPLSGRLV